MMFEKSVILLIFEIFLCRLQSRFWLYVNKLILFSFLIIVKISNLKITKTAFQGVFLLPASPLFSLRGSSARTNSQRCLRLLFGCKPLNDIVQHPILIHKRRTATNAYFINYSDKYETSLLEDPSCAD